MAKGSNGTSRDEFCIVTAEYPELRYVVFTPSESLTPDSDILPGLLSKTVSSWMATNPNYIVISTLPILQHGSTVAVHLWYEEYEATA